eukprot:UN16038
MMFISCQLLLYFSYWRCFQKRQNDRYVLFSTP